MIVVVDRNESARPFVASLASVPDQLVRQRDGDLDGPLVIRGQRLGLPSGDRTISTTRIVEGLIASSGCQQQLDAGVGVDALTKWLADEVVAQMTREAERGFMDVAG